MGNRPYFFKKLKLTSMLTTTKISTMYHQPIPVNVADYAFNGYNQVQGWADIKEPKSSSS